MGTVSFLKEAGERLFPRTEVTPPALASPTPAPDLSELNAAAAAAIAKYVAAQHLTAAGLDIVYDGATQTVTVGGVAPDQATREKIVLCCGNVRSVARVDDLMSVAQPDPPASVYRTVKPGDTLAKIAAEAYGDAGAFLKIFEANRPMLADPERIYPGQTLRIPTT